MPSIAQEYTKHREQHDRTARQWTQLYARPPPPPPAAPAAAATDRSPRVTVRQPANLRTGPDSQSNIVRVVPRGETLRVHGRTANGWVQVGDAEPRGWLHTSRLGEIEQ